jgi:hypothetical protein
MTRVQFRSACDGWIDCRDLGQVFEHEGRSTSCTGSTAMTGAQFEIRIDGTPRTYRDRKDYAMEAARLLKSKNPHSMVEVKDLKSGDVTAVAHRTA